MKAGFSEFSYGYALTEDIVRIHNRDFRIAPIFPSLYEEGKDGGGYDLKLVFGKNRGIPLFLQFKLAEWMSRKPANEVTESWFGKEHPCFRMNLHSPKISHQHKLLLDLEQKKLENLVYYAVPGFFSTDDLNNAFIEKKVCRRSVFFKPSDIKELEKLNVIDLKPSTSYRISYTLDNNWICNKAILNTQNQVHHHVKGYSCCDLHLNLRNRLSQSRAMGSEEVLNSLLHYMENEVNIVGLPSTSGILGVLGQIAYLANIYYSSQLFWVSRAS